MSQHNSLAQAAAAFELRFNSLFTPGKALVFPCDERGCVDMDTLSERARCNYLFAHAMVGKDFFSPSVSPRGTACRGRLDDVELSAA